MNENLRRHRPDIMVLGEGKAIACMPEDPMGVWVHIQDVRDLLDAKDRTIRDYEDNYLPRPKTMGLKPIRQGSPERGEYWVYDAEDVDRVIAAKEADYREACARLQTANLIKDEQKTKADKLLSCLRCLVMRNLIKDCPEKDSAIEIIKGYGL